MKRKTERLYASADLDGAHKANAVVSFEKALENLSRAAAAENREVLYDTLEVSVGRSRIDDSVIGMSMRASSSFATITTIEVSAEAVRF